MLTPTINRPVSRILAGTVAAIAGTAPSAGGSGCELDAVPAKLVALLDRFSDPRHCQAPTPAAATSSTAAPAANNARRRCGRGVAAITCRPELLPVLRT